jgi:group II intron reverse transcriptase/maturase
VETGLGRIAAKARSDKKIVFTSLAHHITKERLWRSLCAIRGNTATGIDGQSVESAKETFDEWADEMLTAVHRKGYKAPPVRRVYIPKPGRTEKRPIGVPCVADRALQRRVTEVLSSIYEQDFLPCSFGGRPKLSAHHALCTFNEIVAGRKVSWVLECDIKNFFGSLDHEWVQRFVEHRVGDPRMVSLIRRWLRAGVLEDGAITVSEEGTPQGGPISVLLSNIYLHYVLDLWFSKVVKPRMRGEAYLIRYLDDFVMCFQYRSDAERVYGSLGRRLGKFGLQMEPNKTKLVEFGRFAARHSKRRKCKLQTVTFLGFTHFCTRNRAGNFMVGRRTAKARFARSLAKLTRLMAIIRHRRLAEQAAEINQVLRGHYAYYGLGGNLQSLHRLHRACERCWRRMLSTRSQRGKVTWEKFHKIKKTFPLCPPKLSLPYSRMQALAVL